MCNRPQLNIIANLMTLGCKNQPDDLCWPADACRLTN